MPEGPEVKTICDQLNSEIRGCHVSAFKILGGRFLKKPPENLEDFLKDISGCTVHNVMCKGKLIWFCFSNGWVLFNTLGMTGSWTLSKEKHSHCVLDVDSDTIYYRSVFFTDPRRFGTLGFSNSAHQLVERINALGPDMLSEPPTIEQFQKLFNKNKTLCELLMNQAVVSGVGNYIKSESLYRAKLSPHRLGSSLSDEDAQLLFESIRAVMQESYAAGGATLATYKNVTGEVGAFSKSLRVYQKETDPEGHAVVSEETPDKRTTFWVPSLQK